jgi:spore photoproduct lyase
MRRGPSIKYREYINLEGNRNELVQQVGSGSIIKRFDRTPPPSKLQDVVCPHFLELKWAYGCPYHCAWCYLQGTLRLLPTKTKPVVKSYKKIKRHLNKFFDETTNNEYIPEILNSGEIADSLMWEKGKLPFSKFIVPIFETQSKHKILFLSKSKNVDNIIKLESDMIIPSFTLNANAVASRWEHGAPSIDERIEAAARLSEVGYAVRIRIDPLVPIDNWEKEYMRLIDDIFSQFKPERITLGSLRGLISTINNANDTSWVKYLSEPSNWGKKIGFELRRLMYIRTVNYLKENYDYNNIAFCKETKEMWKRFGMEYAKIKCNCIW